MLKGYCSKGQNCLAKTDCVSGICTNGLCGNKKNNIN